MVSILPLVDFVNVAQIQGDEAEKLARIVSLVDDVKITDTAAVEENVPHVKTIQDVEEGYSKAHGGKIMWKTNVNLSAPSCKIPDPVEDAHLLDYYNSLQYTLYETGFPETVDRTNTPRPAASSHQVAVAILSAPCECMGILLEGSRQCPDGFHLILSPSWVSKVPSTERPGMYTLYINKAITFHEGGQTYIDEFAEPRRATYLLNYFTEFATSGHTAFGSQIEKNLDCPMSMSLAICELVDNKVWTRGLMSQVGVDVPATLAFIHNAKYKSPADTTAMRTVEIGKAPCIAEIENEVTGFLSQSNLAFRKVVVKPSGLGVLGSVGVTFHDVTDVTAIVNAVLKLLHDFGEGYSVLVEGFVEPINRPKKENLLWTADSNMSYRVRSTVCRDLDNVPVTTLINCGVAVKSSPINGDNTICQTLDTTLRAFNVSDANERRQLEHEIRVKSERVMQAIIEHEQTMSLEEKGELRAQTDVIGIDFIITERDGKLVPVAIEVNGHDCTINCQLYDFMNAMQERVLATCNFGGIDLSGSDESYYSSSLSCRYDIGETLGKSIRPLIRTMVRRSQLHAMRGKKILVIGAGGYSKRFIWTEAAEYGIQIVLVESDSEHFAKDEVYKFLVMDIDDHKQDATMAKTIVNRLCKEGLEVDGCLTFWEDCVPLAALVGNLLGTNGVNVEASCIAKKKSRTQKVLYGCDGDIPHWPRTQLYAAKSYSIKSNQDLAKAAQHVGFPAILKLEHGSSAVGVILINSLTELQNQYTLITESLKREEDFPGIGLGHDNSMLLTEFHGGSEHDIDVVIFNRQLVGAFISDNGPTNYPSFTETAAVMPSSLPANKQAQLITAAYQCCTEIGLSDGTYNVEMKMTAAGPKLIEINARMGGFYLRDWIKYTYGVDMMLCSLMVACGMKPYIPTRRANDTLMGIMLLPSKHSHILHDYNIREMLQEMNENEEIIWSKFSSEAEISDVFEEPFGNISVKGRNVEDARQKLLALCDKLQIETDSYNVSEFVRYF